LSRMVTGRTPQPERNRNSPRQLDTVQSRRLSIEGVERPRSGPLHQVEGHLERMGVSV